MSSPADLLVASFSFFRILALLTALCLAFRFEPRIAGILKGRDSTSPDALPRTVVWLALSSVFSIFLFDLTALLRLLVEVVSPTSWGLAYGMVPTFWGSAATRVFDGLSIFTTLGTYVAVSFPLWRRLREELPPAFHPLAPSRADRVLVLAAIAGLVNLIVRSIVLQVVLIELPATVRPIEKGSLGLAGAWMLGMLITLALSQLFRFRTAASDART